jgi:cytochrome c
MAHGANEKFVGKNMIDLRDADGKEHIRERMELAKTKSSFWQDFKFVNPVTKKMEPKSMYCERADELVVCGGIYKPV